MPDVWKSEIQSPRNDRSGLPFLWSAHQCTVPINSNKRTAFSVSLSLIPLLKNCPSSQYLLKVCSVPVTEPPFCVILQSKSKVFAFVQGLQEEPSDIFVLASLLRAPPCDGKCNTSSCRKGKPKGVLLGEK